ncbi:hypothetical protein QR680_012769 [Steinernema hermaphroditum]|uniref:Uncharacterized protein n=1 Tax=Steinernema hermaphroditum TaxID=289476 RepID=A0AA39I5F9_9BILA|nr:hypothetical protein QR680_012769 [Steinernema hermaphroditum]
MRGVRGLSGAVEGDEFGRRRVLTTSLDGRCRESPGHCVAAPLARPLPYSGGGLFKGSLRDSRRLDRSRRHFRIASVGDAFDESSSSEGGRVTVGAARRELRVDSLWREFSDDFVTSAQLGHSMEGVFSHGRGSVGSISPHELS